MENALISVIVPVYNVAAYLDACVGSLTGQTYKNLEIILIDDGSTDGSPQICDEYPQIKVAPCVMNGRRGTPESA